MVGSRCRDFKNREVTNVNAPSTCHIKVPFVTIQKDSGIQRSLCCGSLFSVKVWMEGTFDMPYKNPLNFFVIPEPNWMGLLVLAKIH